MKKRFKKIAFITIFLSFFWGLWWGFYQDYRLRPENWAKGELNVLTQSQMFDVQFLQKFAAEEGFILKVKSVSTPQAFLQEMLTHSSSYDIIQFNSFLADSFLVENVFYELDRDRIKNMQNISIDFQNLNFDPNSQYLVPLYWGVNGFVYNKEKIENIGSIFQISKQTTLLPSSVESYAYATKMKPIIKNWAATGNEESLLKDLKSISAEFPSFSQDLDGALITGSNVAAQSTNGKAAAFLAKNKNFRFDLPIEKANLWVSVMGVTKDSPHKKVAQEVLNRFLMPKWSEELTRSTHEATVNALLDRSEKILPQQKSQFIRELRLSRFELFYDHESFEPLWMRSLKEVFPQTFANSGAK
ncbi:MAG: extracellular solute-binding protein [Bdellovibrionota bacterium]